MPIMPGKHRVGEGPLALTYQAAIVRHKLSFTSVIVYTQLLYYLR